MSKEYWITTFEFAEHEEISFWAIRKRIAKGRYPAEMVKQVNRSVGGKQYLINVRCLSSQGMLNYLLK